MAHIVLINPRFETSYWGIEHALPMFGKKAAVPVACLPLLAALTPAEHKVTVIDESVEDIDFDAVAQADIVGVTGMIVQRFRMREIVGELKRRGAFVVVGGPWITVQEDYLGNLPDVIFVGEAEETWPRFLQEWGQGLHQLRYEQQEKSDMTKVPTPRHDLVKMQHYVFGSLQISRGCPFQCEFCDIIVTFGRRPRLKTSPQVIAELEALRAAKMNICFVVDDNLIGNKKEIKKVLRDVVDWQIANGYPLTFFTEASLDLADDAELLELLVEANFVTVFIGIETPNEESLRETKKFQNVRQGGTMIEKVHRIQDAGLDVWCGMILGFDHDDPKIFECQSEFLQRARILHAMVGMLSAIPKTPLHERLAAEGRLDTEDQSSYGTNVIPLKMSREQLRDGYVQLLRQLYSPEAYFERLDSLYLNGFHFGTGRSRYWRKHQWTGLKWKIGDLARFAYVMYRLSVSVPEEHLRTEYRRRVVGLLKRRREPAVLFAYAMKCAVHFHYYTMAEQMAEGTTPVLSTF